MFMKMFYVLFLPFKQLLTFYTFETFIAINLE